MSPAESARIRVLIVEDSRVIAEFLTHVLQSDPRLKVVGAVHDGHEALEAVQQMQPDVITMDVHMPKLNGFEATRRIMETRATPIVIVSGSFKADEVAMNFHAMEAGAVAVVARPAGLGHPDHDQSARELVETVKLMSEVKVVRRWPRGRPPRAEPPPLSTGNVAESTGSGPRIVAIGASTGGPIVLQTLLTGLPKDFPLPVVIVQHMSPGFAQGFVEWLARASGFAVSLARDGDHLQPAHAYIAPDHAHLTVLPSRRLQLTHAAQEHGMRPAVSVLFRSVVAAFGAKAVGVLLTGMGRDGVDELLRLKNAGALTIAQDAETSVVHGMPGEAIRAGAASLVLPPEGIVNALKGVGTKL